MDECIRASEHQYISALRYISASRYIGTTVFQYEYEYMPDQTGGQCRWRSMATVGGGMAVNGCYILRKDYNNWKFDWKLMTGHDNVLGVWDLLIDKDSYRKYTVMMLLVLLLSTGIDRYIAGPGIFKTRKMTPASVSRQRVLGLSGRSTDMTGRPEAGRWHQRRGFLT